jgi:hypothetical protein
MMLTGMPLLSGLFCRITIFRRPLLQISVIESGVSSGRSLGSLVAGNSASSRNLGVECANGSWVFSVAVWMSQTSKGNEGCHLFVVSVRSRGRKPSPAAVLLLRHVASMLVASKAYAYSLEIRCGLCEVLAPSPNGIPPPFACPLCCPRGA